MKRSHNIFVEIGRVQTDPKVTVGLLNYDKGVEQFSCLVMVKLRNDTLLFHTMNFPLKFVF